MKIFIALMLSALLVGCAGIQTATPQQKLVTACNAYANALVTLAGYRKAGKLSDAQVKQVDQIRSIVNPICSGSSVPTDLNGALNTVENYALQLNGIQTGAK
jgi:hypothetical protein